jgi:peptidase E
MSNILLFSELTDTNRAKLFEILFTGTQHKTFAYMPSSGVRGSEAYIAEWKDIAENHGTHFITIDNTFDSGEERAKLLDADVLLIGGGNTFQLLHNLRESRLDKTIIEFSLKSDSTLTGFSAGALVLTPTIKICNLPNFDENLVGLKKFDGLDIVDFEIFPHYDKALHKNALNSYRKTTNNPVREITNEDYILVNP